jgi:hypothetical protein
MPDDKKVPLGFDPEYIFDMLAEFDKPHPPSRLELQLEASKAEESNRRQVGAGHCARAGFCRDDTFAVEAL